MCTSNNNKSSTSSASSSSSNISSSTMEDHDDHKLWKGKLIGTKVPSSSASSSGQESSAIRSWIATLSQFFSPVDDDDDDDDEGPALYNPKSNSSGSCITRTSSSSSSRSSSSSNSSSKADSMTASDTEESSSEEESDETSPPPPPPPTPKKTPPQKKQYMQINGDWYHIPANFSHPGGAVIDDFFGRDATEVFTAFHVNHAKVLKRVKRLSSPPPQQYIRKTTTTPTSKNASPADMAFSKEYHQMVLQLQKEGYFEPKLTLMVQKMILAAVCFIVGWYLVFCGTREARENTTATTTTSTGNDDDGNDDIPTHLNWRYITAGAMIIALFFQQCGFLLHDFMHNNWFHDRKMDQLCGRFFGAVCVGLSGMWWRDEHWIHHVFTNTYEDGVGIRDIQIAEDIWAQNIALLQFFDGSIDETIWKRLLSELPLPLSECMIRYQAFLWLPLTVILGRMNIIIVSFLKETRTSERLLQLLHVTWFVGLSYMAFPKTTKIATNLSNLLTFHLLVSIGQGVLHLQLLVSHYVTPWYDISEMTVSSSWYKNQIMATINIAPFFSTRWIRTSLCIQEESTFWNTWDDYYAPMLDDWFHGGLNLHIEHHTIPTLPRNSLREASRRIKLVCEKHHGTIRYDERHFIQAVWDTLVQLHTVGKQAKFTSTSTMKKTATTTTKRTTSTPATTTMSSSSIQMITTPTPTNIVTKEKKCL